MKSSFGGEGFKKRRVRAAKPNLVDCLKLSCTSDCKRTTTIEATLKATDLVPQHLVSTTPGPYLPNLQNRKQNSTNKPWQPPINSNPSSMDLDIMGEQKTQLGDNSREYIVTKNERTVSDTCKRIMASPLMKDKNEKIQKSLTSNRSAAQI